VPARRTTLAHLDMIPLLASGADVNVDFDLSFVAQIALFGLFILILKPILFDPLLKLFEEREKLTDGARADARVMDERAGELVAKFESELEKVRQEAARDRERLRAETAKLEHQMMEAAKADAARILEEGRTKIAGEIEALRKELHASRPALARQIASTLIGREVSS
jgi:F-type H+-transporting ATPase subunit b